jgi:hypothetical protein
MVMLGESDGDDKDTSAPAAEGLAGKKRVLQIVDAPPVIQAPPAAPSTADLDDNLDDDMSQPPPVQQTVSAATTSNGSMPYPSRTSSPLHACAPPKRLKRLHSGDGGFGTGGALRMSLSGGGSGGGGFLQAAFKPQSFASGADDTTAIKPLTLVGLSSSSLPHRKALAEGNWISKRVGVASV